jgi:2-polyprenyl-3-methyl-5-hydroxy-6-metoxy-1,4-benzoquinol methylase
MRIVRDDPRRPDPGFAALYATLPDVTDVEPWLTWARRAGGPVLYLGAGAGRIAAPLAQAGVELVLVDAHPGMVEILRGRLPRAEVIQALIEDLDLDRRFGLVMGPSGVLGRLPRLRAAARHLAAGGRVALELMNPHWLLAARDPRVRVRELSQGRTRLEVDHPGGYTQLARERLLRPERTEAFVRRGGLRLEWMGGAAVGPLAGSPTFYVLAGHPDRMLSSDKP